MLGERIMERKIMSLGKSSLVISLPKNWIQLNSLNKGDVVSYAIQRDRSLVVSPGPEKKRRIEETSVMIEADEDTTDIVRKIIASYLNGYSGIKIVSNSVFSASQKNAIRNVAGKLYIRIMDSDAQSMYLEALNADKSTKSVKQSLNRIQTLCLSMCNEVLKSLKTNDINLAKSVYSIDDEVDHFSFFITRLLRNAVHDSSLARELGIDPVDCIDYQTLVNSVEHVADYTADIARYMIMLKENQQEMHDDVLTLILATGTEAVDLYAEAVDTFLSKDVPVSIKMPKYQERIEQLGQKITSKAFMEPQKNDQLVFAICSIFNNIRKIADSAVDIAETAINRAFKAEF
jgi:phosphate uptake regulator